MKPFQSSPGGQSRMVIAVMPNRLVGLCPTSLPTPEVRQPLDDRTITAIETETQNRTDGSTTFPLSKEELEHVARHSTGQDVPPITAPGVDPFPTLLGHPATMPSPVTRLPFEILAYIFEFYVARGIESTLDPVPTQGPFYLAQVCKHWRAVAESDPHLWASIQLYFPDSYRRREEDVLRVKHVFDMHLKRSGTLPMSLTFTDHRIYHSTTEDLVSLLVDRLRMHARRWKRISLQLSCGYFPLLFSFTPCDLSSLEYLYISGDVPAITQHVIAILHLSLESATNLKSFTYSGPGHLVDDRINLDWETLAEVSFEFAPHYGTSSTLSRHSGHLAQCRNITTLSLGIDRPFWPGVNNGEAITLLCVQTLRVRRLSPYAHARTAIDPLILPRLQTLEIDTFNLVIWNEHWHNHTFSSLLERSKCTLRHLSIQDVDFPNDELVRCLALSHELTSFRFIPCPRSQNIRDVIRKLYVSRTAAGGRTRTQRYGLGHVANGPLIPQLREITLASSVEGYLDFMLEMFRSRVGARAHAAGVTALRRAEVVFFDMSHDTDVDRVSLSGSRLRRLAKFQTNLARWVSGVDNEKEGEDRLEASVVVDSPYLAEYIDVQ